MTTQQFDPIKYKEGQRQEWDEKKMSKNPWIAGILNFFLLGAGTIYNGRRVLVGILLTIGAILSTYVELQLQAEGSSLYWIMFAGFFLLATACAIDGAKEAKSI